MHVQLSLCLYFYLLYLLLNSCDEKKADAVCQKLSKLVHVVKTTACHSRCVFFETVYSNGLTEAAISAYVLCSQRLATGSKWTRHNNN